jgi:hypothetical protein
MKNPLFTLSLSLVIGLGILFSFPSLASAATYYVSTSGGDHPAGSNTAPYDTWAKAANYPADLLTYIAASGSPGNTIYLDNDTWTDYRAQMYFPSVNQNNTTVIGAGRSRTYLSPNNSHTIQTSVNTPNLTFRDMTVNASSAKYGVYLSGSNTVTFNNIDFVSAPGHSALLVLHDTGAHSQFNGCRFIYNSTNVASTIAQVNAGSMDLNSCISVPGLGSGKNGIFRFSSTGTSHIYNSLISGSAGSAILVSNGSVYINNSIISVGAPVGNSYYDVSQSGAGNVYINNNLLYGSYLYDVEHQGVLFADNNNIRTNPDPKFTSFGRKGYILLELDDASSLNYAEQLVPVLNQYGVKMSFNINTQAINPSDYERIRALVNSGVVEIGSHTYSHSNLTYTHALKISYVGTDTDATVTFTNDRVIQLRTIQGNDNLDIDTSSSSTDSLGEIVLRSGTSHWEIIKSTTGGQIPDGLSGLSDSMRATSFLPMSTTSAPCDIDLDITSYNIGYFKDEILDPKNFIADTVVNGAGDIIDPQTGAVFVVNSFVAPYNIVNATSNNAIYNSGFLIGRGVGGSGSLANLNPFTVAGQGLTYLYGDGTEDSIRKKARELAMSLIDSGYAYPLILHGNDTFGITQWRYALDEWNKFGSVLEVTSPQILMKTVLNSGLWVNNSNGTYSRTYQNYSDYSLLPTSPAIDAGTGVGLSTDYLGNSIYGTPDIGAYEYQPPHDLTLATPDTIDVGAGARIYANGKFRDLGTTNSTPANLKVAPASGSFSIYDATTTRPAFLDITDITNWTATHKTWTESNAQSSDMVTSHTVGDLNNSKWYGFTVTNLADYTNITGTNGTTCNTTTTTAICQSNSEGTISFQYAGGYSTHTFDMTEYSSDSTLSNITLNQGSLTPAFSTSTTSYTVSVPSDTTLTVTPTSTESNATITVNGTAVTSGSASSNITLSPGDNTVTIVVTAQDTVTQTTYTINVYKRGPGSGAIVTQLTTQPTPKLTGLTTTQIQSIISLLQSFGADSVTIANVQASLNGGTPTLTNNTNNTNNTFTKDLKLGTVDNEVKLLQQYLNTHGFTITTTGPGSLNNETNVFGSLTKQAVIKFQEKYASEILTPTGLTKGTGMVGVRTRVKLNAEK